MLLFWDRTHDGLVITQVEQDHLAALRQFYILPHRAARRCEGEAWNV